MDPETHQTEPPQVYDGNLLIIANRRITDENPFSVYLQTRERTLRDLHFFNLIVLRTRNKEIKLSHPEIHADYNLDAWETRETDLYEKLTVKYGKKILEILLHSRLRISLLIDTPGGAGYHARDIRHLATHSHKHGGTVQAWVNKQASSAGAMMFEAADERHALTDSRFLWHNGSHVDQENTAPGLRDEEVELELDQIRTFFRANANSADLPAIEKSIASAIADPENHRNNIEFTGRELHEAGVVHHLYGDSEDMRTAFETSTNLPPNRKTYADLRKFWSTPWSITGLAQSFFQR